MLLAPILWFIAGLATLIGGAEILVRSVSKLAVSAGISKLVIGLTIVAFGTSSPELAVSIQAGIDGQTDLMLGNIVGSSIANILLILGLAAAFIPLRININLLKSDVPIMAGITLLVYMFAANGMITFWECLALTILLVVYLTYLARKGKQAVFSENEIPANKSGSIIKSLLLSIGGLVLLILGARWLVSSAIIFAEMAGVSELIIGLTVVAIGTSLPEIVVTLVAAIKRESDIAIGNVIGSNSMNLLAVLGISGLVVSGPLPVQDMMLRFDMIVLIAASLLCIPLFYTRHKIARWEGFLLLFYYFSYLAYLYLSSVEHDLISIYEDVMLYGIIPVTLFMIGALTILEWKKRFRFRNFNQSKKNE